MSYYIEKFVPFRYEKFGLETIGLNNLLGKHMLYASCGKAALYHCLLSLGMQKEDKILVPNYICASVLVPILKLGLVPVYYDIDKDLNANIDSIKYNKKKDPTIKAILVASMYGNPANLEVIEYYCKKERLLLIDDAAQSFGAKINGRYVGTYGDAGFFSFSPGKATPGHLGAFFWTSNSKYSIHTQNHYIYHMISYWSYYFNRYEIYKYKKSLLGRITKYIELITKKFTDYWNDKLNKFEEPILGGILYENFRQSFRSYYSSRFAKNFIGNDYFEVITKGSIDTNNHKLVILCRTKDIATLLIHYFDEKGIYTINGYSLLDKAANTPIAHNIEKKVIEIPIENDLEKFDYIVECVRNFVNNKPFTL